MSVHRKKLQEEIQYLRKKLKACPKGELFCVKNGKYIKWFQRNNSHRIYIPKAKRSLAVALAEKKYYTLQLDSLLLKEKTILEYEQRHRIIDQKLEQLLQKDSPYLELLREHIFDLPDECKNWMQADYHRNERYPENLVHKTLAGHMVRSKSEAMIANALFVKKIPYRYECRLELEKICFYPDFTILHPRTGELIYWEHFGLMDFPSYCEKAFNKLKVYSAHGIIPSVNLILTYETQKHPIDIETIYRVIEAYL